MEISPFLEKGIIGLFGLVDSGSQIRNLGVEDVNITGQNYVGGLVGYNRGTLTACYATGLVSGNSDCVGGLVGENEGILTSCYATGSVNGDYHVGGLVAYNYGTITNCYAIGDVNGGDYGETIGGLCGYNIGTVTNSYATGVALGASYIGGLVGVNYGIGTITSCYATGSVSGRINRIGGLCGANRYSIITNCYATGMVNGSDYVGGLVGDNKYGGSISCCYAKGVVSSLGDYIGGLVGYDDSGSYEPSFWNSEVNPDVNGIGNETVPDPNVIGETTLNMQIESTFTDAGWDFVGEVVNGPNDVWDICEGTNYPRLVWTIAASDFMCPDGVNGLDFAYLASWWDEGDCDSKDDCGGADLDFSGVVDYRDLKIFCDWWLFGIDD